jgi:hypothetical protein
MLERLFVVIFGILIAFQIDRWGDERRDHKLEHEYLVRLEDDLRNEIRRMEDALEYARSRVAAAALLETVALEPALARKQSNKVAHSLETVIWRSFPQVDAFVYTELVSTGNLALIRSQALRGDLARHYARIHHDARVGHDIGLQQLFEERTAGILSTAELTRIEAFEWGDLSLGVTPDRAEQIAAALSGRTDAVILLPGIAQHNVFNIKVIQQNRDRAQKLVEQIATLLSKP